MSGLWFGIGAVFGFVAAYGHMLWRRRGPISAAIKADYALDLARQTLRNILRVPKVEHAHKLARKTLVEIDI